MNDSGFARGGGRASALGVVLGLVTALAFLRDANAREGTGKRVQQVIQVVPQQCYERDTVFPCPEPGMPERLKLLMDAAHLGKEGLALRLAKIRTDFVLGRDDRKVLDLAAYLLVHGQLEPQLGCMGRGGGAGPQAPPRDWFAKDAALTGFKHSLTRMGHPAVGPMTATTRRVGAQDSGSHSRPSGILRSRQPESKTELLRRSPTWPDMICREVMDTLWTPSGRWLGRLRLKSRRPAPSGPPGSQARAKTEVPRLGVGRRAEPSPACFV